MKLMSFLNKELELIISGLANAKIWEIEPEDIHKGQGYSQEEEEEEEKGDCK